MNNIFSLPPQIHDILQTLERHGYEAYLVGGCVRDYLLGKQPDDFDICTSALPQETMKLFDRCIPTGIAHGTVTVLYDGMQAEVTVFRKESAYSDHRHPDAVSFTTDLTADLSRRDFTVNAMAMDCEGTLRDPFGGRADLAAGILRCVGDPHKRLQEDALRMHRALRFSAQLGFAIEEHTLSAISQNAALCAYVAAERVQTELRKTLLSPHPDAVGEMLRLGLLDAFLPHRPQANLHSLCYLPPDFRLRYARLLYLLNITDPEAVLRSLKLDKITFRSVSRAVIAAQQALPTDVLSMKQLMSREDELTVNCVCACGDYDRLSAIKDGILHSGEPCHIRHLAVTGSDLQKLGIKGTATGTVLRRLLDAVIEDARLNEKNTLLQLAKER